MAKRFTDTDKWKKPFIRGMKAPYKLLWLYVLDECDHAGIWQVDIEVAEIKIGERLKIDVALEQLKDKIVPFDSGKKWLIPDFIDFQYGELNEKNRVHESVLSLLKKYNLLEVLKEKNKPLTSPLQGAKDKDKDKEMDKDKEKEKESGENSEIVFPFETDQFRAAWQFWKDYKRREHKFSYKSAQTEQIGLKELYEISGKDEETALRIIQKSVANGWEGLFEIKNKKHEQPKFAKQIDLTELNKSADEFLRKSGLGRTGS